MKNLIKYKRNGRSILPRLRFTAFLMAVIAFSFATVANADARGRQSIFDIVADNPDLSILAELVVANGLDGALSSEGQFTLFAPNNNAFGALTDAPDDITTVLLNHVVDDRLSSFRIALTAALGGTEMSLGGQKLVFGRHPLTVNNIVIIHKNIRASNGIVHIIEEVILEPTPTIVDVAINREDLSTLVTAVVKAELVETLSGEGPFTVFAPDNDAFEDFGIDPENVDVTTLEAVLLDHVVIGEYKSWNLRRLARKGDTLTAIGGLVLDFGRFPLSVNGLTITKRNIEGSNGIIQIIDGVLLE
jgi:transforming growth factor-beta-induced protein